MLPPGDLRMALAALCGDDEWGQTWARGAPAPVRRRRRDARPRRRQPADRRALGAARRPRRRPRLGRPAARARTGRVLPMALTPLGHHRRGARSWTRRPGRASRPSAARSRWPPPTGAIDLGRPRARRPAGRAPRRVDGDRARPTGWCSGPGSWFTSVIPHLLVPGAAPGPGRDRRAGRRRAQPRAAGRRDPRASSPADHLAALLRARPRPAGAHRAGRRGSVGRDRCSWSRPSRPSAPGSSSPTSPPTTAHRATTPASSPRPTHDLAKTPAAYGPCGRLLTQ